VTRRVVRSPAGGSFRVTRTGSWWRSAAALALSSAVAVVAGGAGAEARRADRFDTVVVDAGHGGEDRGAVGARGLAEKDLVLDVARRLARRLRERSLRVVLTRDADAFVPLEERTSLANDAHADLFLSIHANAAGTREPSGIETYFVSVEASDDAARAVAERENEAFGEAAVPASLSDPLVELLGDLMQNEYERESGEFARLVQKELATIDGAPSRGVKQAPFVVLMGVQMPASLIEIGFLTNRSDEAALRGEKRRDAIADALTRAVVRFGERYDARHGAGPDLSGG
jgi:N-acetylmuramoyl-L-alanine amidase